MNDDQLNLFRDIPYREEEVPDALPVEEMEKAITQFNSNNPITIFLRQIIERRKAANAREQATSDFLGLLPKSL